MFCHPPVSKERVSGFRPPVWSVPAVIGDVLLRYQEVVTPFLEHLVCICSTCVPNWFNSYMDRVSTTNEIERHQGVSFVQGAIIDTV